MKLLISLLLVTTTINCFCATYQISHIWTGDNQYSGAPSPACSCDKDIDAADCTDSFDSIDLGSICYDEYIPEDSEGWGHAYVFIKQ
jgi:hypothetical protein